MVFLLPERPPTLRCISQDEELLIPATDGREIIATATDVFATIDPNFRNWDAVEFTGRTPPKKARVYEQYVDARFTQMFGSFGIEFRELAWAQSQILTFVNTYPSWLGEHNTSTFFPFVSKRSEYVAEIRPGKSFDLIVHIHNHALDHIWSGAYLNRVVVPQ